jgi:hypothetical protein
VDEPSIAAAATNIADLDLVIVATGLLQRDPAPSGSIAVRPEKTWRSLDPAVMAESFAINTIAPAIIAKHILAETGARSTRRFCSAVRARRQHFRQSPRRLAQLLRCKSGAQSDHPNTQY